MSDLSIIEIARCPEHGIHGERPDCFVCGGEVQQLAMVHVADLVEHIQRAAETLSALNLALVGMAEARSHLSPGMRAGTAEAIATLDRAIVRVRQRLAQAGVA